MMQKIKYRETPVAETTLWIHNYYSGNDLTREETATISGASDVYHDWWRRISPDNGRSWSEPEKIIETLPGIPLEQSLSAGGMVIYPQIVTADPHSGNCYRFFMQRLFPGRKPFEQPHKPETLTDHVFVTEQDGNPVMLRYETGPECDFGQPFSNPDYHSTNQAYYGVNAEIEPDGTILFPVATHVWRDGVLQNGVCLFRRDPDSGQWLSSNVVLINPDWSSRGLLEPSVARLRNGNIMVICRGSDTPRMPGRKWFVYSADNGRTLSEVQELRYDDASQFFSPSSIHRLIRSARNGILYWIANIIPEPPNGNSPRYPLVIARIDEDRMAVVKSGIKIIDDKTPKDPDILQLSNFCALEDRETGNIEILMSRWGENHGRKWHGDAYKYVLNPENF